MSASFPTSVKTFTTHVDGPTNTIYAAHINDIQDEVMAIETGVIRALKKIYNVLDYGADPTGVADSTSAFQSAIAAAKSASGTVYVPSGEYKITSTLDLSVTSSGQQNNAMIGALPTPILRCTISGGPAITFGNGAVEGTPGYGAFYTKIANLTLAGTTNGGACPTSAISGQSGISCTTYGAGASTIIENVSIGGFANHAILIQGPTGPVAIRDCSIASCAGYGVWAGPGYGYAPPQNVSVYGGSIQDCYGGVCATEQPGYAGTSQTSIYCVDIELLADTGIYPAVYISPSSQSFYASGCTLSTRGTSTTGSVVYCMAIGAVFEGCLTWSHNHPYHNYHFDGSACYNCTVVGGFNNNYSSGSSGYLVYVGSGAKKVVAVNPHGNAGVYETNKNTMYVVDGSGAGCQGLGITVIYP